MNHLRHYLKLIRKAQTRGWTKKTAPCYVEEHHIFPVKIFGDNNFTVCLTAREHYIAHALLALGFWKRYGKCEKSIRAMHAWSRMSNQNRRMERYTPKSSKVYELERSTCSVCFSESGRKGGLARTEKQKESTKRLSSDSKGRRESGRKGGLARTKKQIEVSRRSKLPKGASLLGNAAQPVEAKRLGGRVGASKTNGILMICLVSGRIANPGNLTKIQNSLGVDTKLRRRLTNDELARHLGVPTHAEEKNEKTCV